MVIIVSLSPHQLRPCGEERNSRLVAAFEGGNVGVLLGKGSVQFINQVIITRHADKAFFLQIHAEEGFRVVAFCFYGIIFTIMIILYLVS